MSNQLDSAWVNVQTKTFTKWVNSKLKKAAFPTIDNLFTDLTTGVPLANLIFALGKGQIQINPNPKARISKMENLSFILEHIKALGISLVNIGASDIVDGDQKLILGLVWTIISRMSISEIMDNEMYSMREELLDWARKVTASYENVELRDFGESWKNGLAFNAVIHHYRPNLLKYDILEPHNARENLVQAFDVAHKMLDIACLLDPEDILDSEQPDERSVITYVSQYYQKFKPEDEKQRNRAEVADYVRNIDRIIQSKNDYETKAKEFLSRKRELEEKHGELIFLFNTISITLREQERENADLIKESVALAKLYNDIQDLEKLLSLASYNPPVAFHPSKLTMEYLDGMSMDIDSLRETVHGLKDQESQQLVRTKNSVREILALRDKPEQIAEIDRMKNELARTRYASPNKQKLNEDLLQLLSEKRKMLEKHISHQKLLEANLFNGERMFKIIDAKRTGSITSADARRILKNLQLESLGVIGESIKEVTWPILKELISSSGSLFSSPCRLRSAFESISISGMVDMKALLPDQKVVNIKLTKPGVITMEDLVNLQ